MTTRNMGSGPDEDEHYEARELGHPNKAFRNLHAAEIINEEHSRALLAVSASLEAKANEGRQAQLAALAHAGGSGGAALGEQVRASKNQAIEILRVLDAESLLERPVGEYVQDVEAAYNEADPKATFPKLRAAWTREEDRLLMVGVRVYGPNTESWPRIAMLVPGRTNKSCRKRWFHSLDPSLHKGPWTAEEDELLRQRVGQFPSQWSRVAEGIPGRTDDQCAKRWRESLDPEIDRSKWRPEEDRLLLEKYRELGTQWQKIATFFQGRPGLHCRNRWRKIHRVMSQKDKKKGADITRDLALVTESVNRRKTAQRSRPQGKAGKADVYGAEAYGAGGSVTDLQAPLFTFSSLDMSPQISGSSGGTLSFDQQQQLQAPLSHDGTLSFDHQRQQRSHSQDQLYSTLPQFGLSASLIGSNASSAGTTFGDEIHAAANFSAYMQQQQQQQHPGIGAGAAAQPQVGSPEAMAALYMPSAEQPASAERTQRAASALRQGAPGGVKRTSSVMYSPTDEQRQRLQQLKLRLYGCAAADSCDAAFGDAVSLNSHLKIVHPSVAALIPSLSMQGTGDPPGAPGPDAGEALTSAAGVAKPYRCAMRGCGHTYKNVNGLEYHIFQSRKARDHLRVDGGDRPAGSKSVTPDVARESASPLLDAGDAGSLPVPAGAAGQLQCTEVDCLARFGSEHELRQHMAAQHPRPIRRAMKP
ncbi:hypothetical protein LPJ70_004305, partial [Coemansia sp. RSA 2708]